MGDHESISSEIQTYYLGLIKDQSLNSKAQDIVYSALYFLEEKEEQSGQKKGKSHDFHNSSNLKSKSL